MRFEDFTKLDDDAILYNKKTKKTCTKRALVSVIEAGKPLYKIEEIPRPICYPNARRSTLSVLFFVCQGCGANKLDIDLYQDTGLCGDCSYDQFTHKWKQLENWEEKS